MKNPNTPDTEHHQKHPSFNLVKTSESAPDSLGLYKLAFWVQYGTSEDIAKELHRIADSMGKAP
jgi:hypothetical protein